MTTAPLVSNYTVKETGQNSFFDFHLDWNMVDETQSRSVTIWCPLQDLHPKNGNLWIMERSNQLGNSYRAGPGLHLYFDDPNEMEGKKFLRKTVCVRAGDAIIYDHKLFHGSPPNVTDQPRIAINQAMAASEFSAVHYISDDTRKDNIEMYEVDDDFFCKCIIGERGEMGRKLRDIKVDVNHIIQEQVNELIHEEITIEENVGDDLERNGYAIIPRFLKASEIAQLKGFYNGLEEDEDQQFYTSHWLMSSERKQRIHDYINPIIKKTASNYFSGTKDVFSYFLVKKSGTEGKVTLHQDWSLVDENKYRAYSIWIPLVNTTEENGCFQAIPGSHKIFNNLRGSLIDMPYIDVSEQLETGHAENIQMNAGDALVFDHRLVHLSQANLSGTARVAIGHVLIPENVRMIHYTKRDGDSQLVDIYEADDEFLLRYSFGDDPAQSDALKLIRSIPFDVKQMDASELEEKLAQQRSPVFT